MGLSATFVFYLLFGAGVSTAVYLADRKQGGGGLAFRVSTALLFWPVYLPILLDRPDRQTDRESDPPDAPPTDDMAVTIAQVDRELDAALGSLDGWAEEALSREFIRMNELRAAWNVQADRIRELDIVLSQTELAVAHSPPSGAPGHERWQRSQQNVERLRRLRRQMYDDLMGMLAWVRELITMIHLARFTGAPASRAAELVSQIAASVEGLSEVSHWHEELPDAAPVSSSLST